MLIDDAPEPTRMIGSSILRFVRRRPFLAAMVLIAAGVVGYIAYKNVFPDYTNRFRLSIEVETPEGLKSGSSVIETRFFASGCWLREACGMRAEARGEAVYVDLGRGRNLVALLSWGRRGEDREKLFELTRAALAPGREIAWSGEYKLKGTGDLPSGYVPTFVTFANLNDAKSGRIIGPAQFETAFGTGVRFRRAWIETTDAPRMPTVTQLLPWLSSHKGYLGGPRPDLSGERPLANLMANDFVRGP